MSYTETQFYLFKKPDSGTEIDTWGNLINGDLDSIDSVLAAKADVTYVDSRDAMKADKTEVSLFLSSALTYYVRVDGNDNNTGLVDSAAGAFLTVQKAVDVAVRWNLGKYNITVQIGAGTFLLAQAISLKEYQTLGGIIIIQGQTGLPSTTVISGGTVFTVFDVTGSVYTLQNLKISNCLYGILVNVKGVIYISQIDFNNFSLSAMLCRDGGIMFITGNLNFSGNTVCQAIFFVVRNSMIHCDGTSTYTFSLITTVTGATLTCNNLGLYFKSSAVTFVLTGTVTGIRYSVNHNSIANTAGGGINLFPGTIAGTVSYGGQYL